MFIYYVDHPPQWARLQINDGANQAYDWAAGDRIYVGGTPGYANGEHFVWVCTVGGNANVYTALQKSTSAGMATTVVAGPTTWVLQHADSWSTALPKYKPYDVNNSQHAALYYISKDYEPTSAEDLFNYSNVNAYAFPANSVCVQQGELVPATGRCYAMYMGGGAWLFGRHGRDSPIYKLLGIPRVAYREQIYSSYGNRATALGAVDCVTSRAIYPQTLVAQDQLRHVRYDYYNNSNNPGVQRVPIKAFEQGGTGVTFDAVPPLAVSTDTTGNWQGRGTYQHTTANQSSSFPTVSATPGEFSGPPYMYPETRSTGNGSEDSPQAGIIGNGISFYIDRAVYRSSAVPAGDIGESIRLGTGTLCNEFRPARSPKLEHYNTLTGARTVKVRLLTNSPFETLIDDKDVWIEVLYPSSATTAQYGYARSANVNFLCPEGAGTPIPVDATSTWVAPGLSGVTQFVISLPVTIQRGGELYITLGMASIKLAQWSVYLCPYVEVV